MLDRTKNLFLSAILQLIARIERGGFNKLLFDIIMNLQCSLLTVKITG